MRSILDSTACSITILPDLWLVEGHPFFGIVLRPPSERLRGRCIFSQPLPSHSLINSTQRSSLSDWAGHGWRNLTLLNWREHYGPSQAMAHELNASVNDGLTLQKERRGGNVCVCVWCS